MADLPDRISLRSSIPVPGSAVPAPARLFRSSADQKCAGRVTVTRLTVSKVEHGDPTVSMGIYARVLFALNLEKDITLLAADDALGRQLQDAELLRK